jgi:hypothetical protein
MKQFCISFMIFLFSQKSIAQPWTSLGSNEQTQQAIANTGANTFFIQVSANGIPYMSYIDDIGGNHNFNDFKVRAKRFNNAADAWEPAGNAISPSFPGSDDFPVALDGNTPYVAYSEAFLPADLRNKLSVKRLNANTGEWDIVGQQGLSESAATGSVMAVDNGKIYIVYTADAVANKITAKRFDNANPANGWQPVGPAGFSNGFVLGTRLAIDNGIPYVAYLDFGDNAVHVKKFTGAAWQDVGTNSPSGGLQVTVQSLQFSNHIPFIVFADATGAGTVRNLDANNAWITTGGQPFAVQAETPSISILNDRLYVAFGKMDNNNVVQVHVKRFNATDNSWVDAGNQPVSASPVSINNIALTASPADELILVFHSLSSGIYAKVFEARGNLPVTLTSFTVSNQNEQSLLQWHTESEGDNRLFEIEQSSDGAHFSKIGEVRSQLPAGNAHDYNFTDANPAAGINFYRLKEVGLNGDIRFSSTVIININTQQPAFFKIFPNPVKNILHTQYANDSKKEIVIRDAAGKEIKRATTTARTLDINAADFAAGTYFISMYSDTITETRSFVKQ